MVLLGGLEIVAAGYIIHKHNKNKKERQRVEEEEDEMYAVKHQERHRRHRSGSRNRHDGKSGRRYHSADERDGRDGNHGPLKPTLVHHPGLPMGHQQQTMAGLPPYAQVVGGGPSYPYPYPQARPQPPQATQTYPQDIKYGWTNEPRPTPMHPQQHAQDPSYPPTGWPAHWSQSQSPEPNTRNGRERSEARVRLAVPGEAGVTQPGEDRTGSRGRGRERRARSESASPPPMYRG